MKSFKFSFVFFFSLYSVMFAFKAHDQSLSYKHPAIVVYQGISYVSIQDVPYGTIITSTNYWTPLLGTAPNTDPGSPPTTEPSDIDSNLSNLTPPDDNKVLISISLNGVGSVSGGGYFQVGDTATLEAFTQAGYLFTSWSGDMSSASNPLALSVGSDLSLTANFTEDLNDNDLDGLSNYAEIIVHGTDPNDHDSDDDAIPDGKEIEIGTNPLVSDQAAFNYGLASGEMVGKAEGEQSVINNPSAYQLVSLSAYEDLMQSFYNDPTPYTPGWFYMPDQGWVWSNKDVYPWFYDRASSNWMYFQSGHENPRFYHYGTKEWMNLEQIKQT